MIPQERDVRRYMERCIELAKECKNYDIRKPFIGAIVLSHSGTLIGEGQKRLVEGTSYSIHAERVALDQAGNSARNGILVTTLEPCISTMDNVFKSCSEMIVERGIRMVFFGLYDNSPTVNSGAGAKYLIKRHIKVFQHESLNSVIRHELMPYRYNPPINTGI